MEIPLQEAEKKYQAKQISILGNLSETGLATFDSALENAKCHPLLPDSITTLQVNLGKLCNQSCKHCHVKAGPLRIEIMTREVMQHCLNAFDRGEFSTVDMTGGAPEMNPDFRWFVGELRKRDTHIINRCNLTILHEEGYEDLIELFVSSKIEIVASLPAVNESQTDSQRGKGVYEKSIESLQMLNQAGYGKPNTGLILSLVTNPSGAFLPGDQCALESKWKQQLKAEYGIVFNNLFTITNIPVGRFLDFLDQRKMLNRYVGKLISSFNGEAAKNVMCKSMISVDWQGNLYDCDFNQMLGLMVNHGAPSHIKNFDLETLRKRRVMTGMHCYGCTAGDGSSCGGATA
jgi:radical SAM/Cys-rich protein